MIDSIIDLSKIEFIDRIHFVRKLPQINAQNDFLEQTFIRANSVIDNINYNCDDLISASNRIRAALTDFSSMEDVAKRECGDRFISIIKTQDPLLIILKQLRNYEIHIGSNILKTNNRDLLWGHPDKVEDAIQVNIPIVYIDNLTKEEFSKLDFAKLSNYHLEALLISLSWFNLLQKEWGIDELIYRGTVKYIDYLSYT